MLTTAVMADANMLIDPNRKLDTFIPHWLELVNLRRKSILWKSSVLRENCCSYFVLRNWCFQECRKFKESVREDGSRLLWYSKVRLHHWLMESWLEDLFLSLPFSKSDCPVLHPSRLGSSRLNLSFFGMPTTMREIECCFRLFAMRSTSEIKGRRLPSLLM